MVLMKYILQPSHKKDGYLVLLVNGVEAVNVSLDKGNQ